MNEGTIILACTCEHAFQDEIYGKGMRVHNVNKKNEAHCTVCCPSHRVDKNGETISPNVGMGMLVALEGRRPRRPKKVA